MMKLSDLEEGVLPEEMSPLPESRKKAVYFHSSVDDVDPAERGPPTLDESIVYYVITKRSVKGKGINLPANELTGSAPALATSMKRVSALQDGESIDSSLKKELMKNRSYWYSYRLKSEPGIRFERSKTSRQMWSELVLLEE